MLANRFKKNCFTFYCRYPGDLPNGVFAFFAFTGEAFFRKSGRIARCMAAYRFRCFYSDNRCDTSMVPLFSCHVRCTCMGAWYAVPQINCFYQLSEQRMQVLYYKAVATPRRSYCPLFFCLVWMGLPGIFTNLSWKVDPATFSVYFLFLAAAG